MERSIDTDVEGKSTTVQKATEHIGEERNGCDVSESDHTNLWFLAGIASSVSDFGPSPVAPQVATVDGAHHENGFGGPAAVGGTPTATAYIHGRKHHSKSQRRN